MREVIVCRDCRHRIYRQEDGVWQLTYKLYDGDTTICQARGGFENLEPHRPLGLTDDEQAGRF